MKLNHPDDLSSFDYKLHKNLVTFVLENDDVEVLDLPCTLDVLNPWNEHLTTLTLFPDGRNEELLNDKNKVCYIMVILKVIIWFALNYFITPLVICILVYSFPFSLVNILVINATPLMKTNVC
jgi:hypothetical protein